MPILALNQFIYRSKMSTVCVQLLKYNNNMTTLVLVST